MKIENFPEEFKKSVKSLFEKNSMGSETEEFFESLCMNYVRGIRFNRLKVSDEKEFVRLLELIYEETTSSDEYCKEFVFEKIPWSDDGYYIPQNMYPGRHPLYNSGIFYIQEPSAMLPGRIADVKPGERILDICAAPGGKTLKLASDMEGEGILFSNDINSERTKALIRNIELAGCTNCVVLNESPEKLSNNFYEYFDKVLIDAPCSGEGMFRKDFSAIVSWEKFGPETCVVMQREILRSVDKMVKNGGEIIYSTCTFNSSENEEMMNWFLHEFPNYRVVVTSLNDDLLKETNLSKGFNFGNGTENALRVFPHKAKGEGHFVVKLKKHNTGNEEATDIHNPEYENKILCRQKSEKKSKGISVKTKIEKNLKYKSEENDFSVQDFKDAFNYFGENLFSDKYLSGFYSKFKNIQIFSNHVYALPEYIPDLNGLNVPKKGFYIGKVKKTREKIIFEPSHSLAITLKMEDVKYFISFASKNIELQKYLKGQTLFTKDVFNCNIKENIPDNGYVLIGVLGYSLGWGKVIQKNTIKNLYPPGWVRSNDII